MPDLSRDAGSSAQGASGWRRRTRFAALLAGAALLACSDGGQTTSLGSQSWGSIDIAVEVRPSPPREGHNEVVVLVSAERQRPVYDALVWVRAQPSAPWVQAIEDGHVGVYRRAVNFGRGPDATLEVQIRHHDAETVVRFPVQLQLQQR